MKSKTDKAIKVVIVCMLVCSFVPLCAADVTVNINGASVIRTIPDSMYGANLRAWIGYEDGHTELAGRRIWAKMQKATGQTCMRTPGGSWGDCYLWSDMEGPNNGNTWIVSYPESLNYLTQITTGSKLQPIVNFPGVWYGQGHGHQAAVDAAVAWVQDQSSRNPTAEYWEIGNEVSGSWECGYFPGINGTYYGNYFADFYIAMKEVNPNIKIGAVGWAVNDPWDVDTLNAAFAKGVVPDFLIQHDYPNPSSDAALLGGSVDEIANYTNIFNNHISSSIGSQYVGLIKYNMTEWRAGGDRWKKFVGAMFLAQHIMEMARYGWAGNNSFGDFWWTSNGTTFDYTTPDTYVYPFLTKKFGRTMLSASTSNWPTVRAYASKDGSSNLWVLLCNNNLSSAVTAQVNITGFVPYSSGEKWVLEGATDPNFIKINGTTMSDPCSLITVGTMAGQTIATASTFSYSMPKGSITFIRIPGNFITAPTGLSASPGFKMVSLDWNDNNEADLAGYNIYRSTTSGSDYNQLNSSLLSTSNYIDYNVINETTYYYVVTAVDTNSHESAYSNEASVTPSIEGGWAPITSADFESGFGEWVNVSGTGDTHDWTRYSGDTPSDSTGPSGGANGSTWYVYLETSRGGAYYAGNTAYLEGPEIGGNGRRTLTFYYHMYGRDIGTLNVDVNSGSSWNNVWSLSGPQQGASSDPYIEADVNLSAYTGTIKIRFRAVAAGGSYGDMAIDDIKVTGDWVYGDLTYDNVVDMNDLYGFCERWWLVNDCNETDGLDLNEDCIINFYEYSRLAQNWLEEF